LDFAAEEGFPTGDGIDLLTQRLLYYSILVARTASSKSRSGLINADREEIVRVTIVDGIFNHVDSAATVAAKEVCSMKSKSKLTAITTFCRTCWRLTERDSHDTRKRS